MTKGDSRDPVPPGGELGYTLRITNTGGTAVTSVVVTEIYDSQYEFGSATPEPTARPNVWTCASIAAGTEEVITIAGSVTATAAEGNHLENNVNVTAANAPAVAVIETTLVSGVVPTLPQWALIMLAFCLAVVGATALRRRFGASM